MKRWNALLVASACLALTACSAALQIEAPEEHGTVEVGDFKDVVFTITNSGSSSARGLMFAPLPNGWEHVGGSCEAFLERRTSCSHTVRFAPGAAGDYEAVLAVSYSGKGGHTQTATRPLHGVAIAPSGPTCYRGIRSYAGWSEESRWDMHAWEGERTALYAREKFDDALACEATKNMDTCFRLYQKLGQREWPSNRDPHFPGKGTLAIVPDTCGAGCGAGGKAEITEQTFANNGGDPSDPYALWVGFYEFGREAGQPFPFYAIISHDPERMTSAFPEYVWSTCLRDLGLSAEELAQRGPFSPAIYRERFLMQTASYVQYQARSGNAEWRGVAPGQLMAAVFYDLHDAFGEAFMQDFFARSAARQDAEPAPSDAYQAACNLLQNAESIDLQRRAEVRAFLEARWRFPDDCSEFDATCTGLPSQACAIEHGVGYQSRTCEDGVWSSFDACIVASCVDGYKLEQASCVPLPPDLVLDLDLYCRQTYGAGFRAVLDGTTVYNWQCVSDTGERHGMDLNAGCQTQHNVRVAAFHDYNDPYSWYCKDE